MQLKVMRSAWKPRLGLGLAAILALCAGTFAAKSDEVIGIALVTPGMNQTELQSVLGPPDYIQVKGLRQAWQYCPRRFFIRFLDRVFRRDEDLFITVWFTNGRVEHMRAYPGRNMGQCEDFFAAFSWEDVIDGVGGFQGTYSGGAYPIK